MFGWNSTKVERHNGDKFTIAVALLHPKSLGNITLRTSNPFDHPVIEPNYLFDDEDVKVLVQGRSIVLLNI